MNKFTK